MYWIKNSLHVWKKKDERQRISQLCRMKGMYLVGPQPLAEGQTVSDCQSWARWPRSSRAHWTNVLFISCFASIRWAPLLLIQLLLITPIEITCMNEKITQSKNSCTDLTFSYHRCILTKLDLLRLIAIAISIIWICSLSCLIHFVFFHSFLNLSKKVFSCTSGRYITATNHISAE